MGGSFYNRSFLNKCSITTHGERPVFLVIVKMKRGLALFHYFVFRSTAPKTKKSLPLGDGRVLNLSFGRRKICMKKSLNIGYVYIIEDSFELIMKILTKILKNL